jgi:citrate synthase
MTVRTLPLSPHAGAAPSPAAIGLDEVVVAETVLSHVDGAAGRLIVRGYELRSLAGWAFEGVVALLWRGFAAEGGDADAVHAALGAARVRAFAHLAPRLAATDGLSPVEALRFLLAGLADAEAGAHHVLAVAAVPVFAAAVTRRRRGLAPVAPNPAIGQAADFLRMLHGHPASPRQVAALDRYLVTVADHGLNASTFAARVIASTRAGLFSAVIGGLSALKGPLHGGAPGPVLDMLDAIGERANIVPWLEAALGRGDRLMGFGHRIYRIRDPRADVLKAGLRALGDATGRIRFAEAVEAEALRLLAEAKPLRPLATNVEFYTALLLEAVGFPREDFTNVFAAGRMAGWTAHVLEQESTGRLIRPQSRYVGPEPVAA